jgi:hypothetical protein
MTLAIEETQAIRDDLDMWRGKVLLPPVQLDSNEL